MNVWHYAPIKQQWRIQRGGGTVGAVPPYWLKFFSPKSRLFRVKGL